MSADGITDNVKARTDMINGTRLPFQLPLKKYLTNPRNINTIICTKKISDQEGNFLMLYILKKTYCHVKNK